MNRWVAVVVSVLFLVALGVGARYAGPMLIADSEEEEGQLAAELREELDGLRHALEQAEEQLAAQQEALEQAQTQLDERTEPAEEPAEEPEEEPEPARTYDGEVRTSWNYLGEYRESVDEFTCDDIAGFYRVVVYDPDGNHLANAEFVDIWTSKNEATGYTNVTCEIDYQVTVPPEHDTYSFVLYDVDNNPVGRKRQDLSRLDRTGAPRLIHSETFY